MIRRALAIACSLWLAGPALAQMAPGAGGSMSPIPAPVSLPTNSVSALTYAPGTVCAGGTDLSAGVAAAIAAGNKKIYLPPGCSYTPPSNTVPAGIEIDGGDWNTSIVSVANRATDSLLLGAHTTLRNVGVISTFCDTSVNPVSTQKVCPVGLASNIGDATFPLTNWVYQGIFLGDSGSSTGPTGVVSTDTPLFAVLQSAPGSDGAYLATTGIGGGTSAARVVTGATGTDNGILLLNGFYNSSTIGHKGIFIKDFSNNNSSTFPALYIDRVGNGGNVSHSLTIGDADSVGDTNTTPYIALSAAHQTSGQLLNIFHSTTTYSGDTILENMANGGGTFSGNFLRLQIAGVDMAKINNAGNLTLAGTLSATGAGTISGVLTAGNAQTEYLTFTGAAANPTIAAAGGAAAANINLNPVGTGVVFINGGSTTTGFAALKGGAFIGNTSANYVNLAGAASGSPSLVNAVGSDSDISLKAVGKGNNGTLTGYFTSTVDPTGSQILSGTCSDWFNTVAVTYKHWCNFGGTLKSVAMS